MKVLLSLVVCVFFYVPFTGANTIVVANTNDAGTGSLRDAISSSNNRDTIRFDPNILSLGSDTIKLVSTININKNLVIIGVYHNTAALYISGDNSFQIFNADLSNVNNPTPKELTIDSLRFIKGSSAAGGGAIEFRGRDLTVRNCTFSNNTSTFGGAILSLLSYGDVTVNACVFTLNSATSFGGGIHSEGGVILIDSDFSDNDALRGGAVFSTRRMSIDNSRFLGNTAIENGGAVNLSSNTSTAYYPIGVTNSTFENNAAEFGGAIYAYFYNTEVDLNIDNSTFNNNHAVWSGGAISASSTWYKSSINLNNSSITNNTSAAAAAGIQCTTVNEKATVVVNNCLVDNNVATGIGGGISVTTATGVSVAADTAYLKVTNSEITNNAASIGGGLSCRGTGGASGSSYLLVEHSLIANNIATLDGGGIYNLASASNDLGFYPANAKTIINYSTVNNNQSGENGGGLFSNSFSAASNATSKSLIFVNQSTFTNNTAVDDGGAIGNYSRNNGFLSFKSGIAVAVVNSTIYNNSATNGGAISSKFSSYSSASDPGAMAAQFTSSIIALNGNSDIYAADSIASLGYNIFSEATIAGSIATDQMQVDSVALALGELQLNGGITPTLLPSIASVAINAGTPSDTVAAQNVPVIGIRDVGAAEHINIMNVIVCDSFVAPSGNNIYYTSGFYTDTLVVNGVDSLVYINLSISNAFSSLMATICTGETYVSPSGGLYTISSSFMDTIPSYLNCDSIISISLVVLNESVSSIDTLACSSYTSPSGILYEIAGVYQDTIVNAVGCDSIITINLSLGNSSNAIIEAACSQYTAPSGSVYHASGIYLDTIPNAIGCDSVITIDLTILFPSTAIDIQVACGSYLWIDGNTYTTSNDSATYTYPGAASNGCDSLVTLNLTIATIDVSVTSTGSSLMANAAGLSYQWLECDNNYAVIAGETGQSLLPSASGLFAVEVSSGVCTDTSACIPFVLVGQATTPMLNEVSIYPNPSTGVVFIHLGDLRNVSIKVFTVSGQLVYGAEHITQPIYQFELNEIGSGVYFVEIARTEGQRRRYKLVKE